ncbi:hypothetical protein ACFV1U_35925 [Streptomyces microflavus]|uniref:hypothetical protein n=1 Tax=Streptomyces microflavus TaxID=1919 RepID=UPI0036C99764
MIGTVRQARHETGSVTFHFEEDRFRVLHGTEPVMANWLTYRWQSPKKAEYLHAVIPTTDPAPAPYTRRYDPTPGVSLASSTSPGTADKVTNGCTAAHTERTSGTWCRGASTAGNL